MTRKKNYSVWFRIYLYAVIILLAPFILLDGYWRNRDRGRGRWESLKRAWCGY